MSINAPLFNKIYENCLSIILRSSDTNIRKKKAKLNRAYIDLCKKEDHELQEFYSLVHELRLYQYLKDLGIKVNAGNDNKAGPDYITELGYIECVCASKGALGTPERKWLNERLNQSLNRYVSALPRLSSAILDKERKYRAYLNNRTIDEKKPCIIAINTSIFSNEFHGDLNTDLVLKILYGIGCRTMRFNLATNNFIEDKEFKSHSYEDVELKYPRAVELSLNYFSQKEFEHISAIILNNNSIGEELEKRYFCLLLNPNALVPVDTTLLRKIKYFILNEINCEYITYRWYNE